MLDHLFTEIDELTQKFGLEKIKTIGDAYMAVAGLPFRQTDHVRRAADFALAVQAMMQELGVEYNVMARIGMHAGAAVAGVIGKTKFVYDLWGDTVNIASRMESHGEAGKVHISEEVYHTLRATQASTPFLFEERGEIEVKGKGVMRTWFLTGNAVIEPPPHVSNS
jgi:adenylate cyclase